MKRKQHRNGISNWALGLLLAGVSLFGLACEENPDDPEDPKDPTFQEVLQAWFSTYNDGQGTEYLSNTGTVYIEGDIDRLADAEPHTYITNRAYGPFSRNVMDLYIPTTPTERMPVVVFIHGGGFTSKDKSDVFQKADIAQYLADGFVVVSANYRWASNSVDDALNTPKPNRECATPAAGCRKDYIFRDGARVIQYLRYASDELNLDPDRIGAWGTSAGGQIVTWVATMPDLADPEHADPVLRESSRLQVVGHSNSQVTGNNLIWPEELAFSDSFWEDMGWYDVTVDIKLHSTHSDLQDTEEGKTLTRIVDYLGAITADDPPMITAEVSPLQ